MFVIFESSDAKKRDAIRDRRLMLLRCAYLNGYFDERETEPMPEIIADGVGSEQSNTSLIVYCPTCAGGHASMDDCPNRNPPWPRLETSIEKLAEQEQRLRAGLPPCTPAHIDGQCIKCNAELWIDINTGENWCENCNPPETILGRTTMPFKELYEKIEKQRLKAEAEAIESVCPACAGFGDRRGQNGENLGECPICKGSCVDPNRTQKCQHRNRMIWTNGKQICCHCGEIIGRDLETGEVT